jgi:hypothetical protein
MKDILLFGWFVVLFFAAVILIGSRYPATTATAAPPTYVSSGKCDSPDTIATVKELASQRLNILFNFYFTLSSKNLTKMHSFIIRGSNCAAQITVHAVAPDGRVWDHELNTEYTVETTTDGEKMVSARFRRND